ncbi:subtilase family-domain-containing protein [Endogone sp. FLAS-F59071]|nr:subtilase family-domain-containing protein [Endogone sp. FLAS-F59071]|eukprot:RUS20247.1 subtilase family-domain-containing protein [Endogone sp. FLAS-F59071]
MTNVRPTRPTKPIPEFPVNGLLPKEDTEAAAFVKKYPEFDGRGTVIAVLDAGIDPGATGLQITTDGKPKIIDIVDCTGSGDVFTATIVKPVVKDVGDETDLQTLQGLSGRTLIISPDWTNPSGEYRLGIKPAYELFPKDLVKRLKRERREKFEQEHHRHLASAAFALVEWDRVHASSSTIPEEELQVRADLEARAEVLRDWMKAYDDPGMIYDCVVFHDGKDWRAVIDVEETGDLRGQPTLTNYKTEQQYHRFGKEDLLNFSVNIYEDGDLLSIVTLASGHGTHVAGITAANFPDEPILNGVAPGAQIISLKIGDTRLGTMETGVSLTRATIALAAAKCDLANMSYGEPAGNPTSGYFIDQLAREAIGKYGCVFVTSAGNDGPTITSIGAPAGMWSGLITVGAYVKNAQVQAEYALLEPIPDTPYTWSSRGPTTDGYTGVDVFAPGSAITSMPVYGLAKFGLKNGTSMSSPNACGCIALLVSGLKAQEQEFSPFRIKTAVVNSAKSVNDPSGVGLIQVDKAWEYLQTYYDRPKMDILFETSITNRNFARGVYLREFDECNRIHHLNVLVESTFMHDRDPTTGDHNDQKFAFESRIALVATETWARTPDFLILHSGGRSFDIKVDPTQLTAGQLHTAEILAYDSTCPARGPLFSVPIFVTKPIDTISSPVLKFSSLQFGPGTIERRFVKVPEGATFVDVAVKSSPRQAIVPALFRLHVLQIVPLKSHKGKTEYTFMVGKGSFGDADAEQQVESVRFSVKSGLNIEFALAQFWSSLGNHVVDLEVSFHGIHFGGSLADAGGMVYLDNLTRLDIVAPIRREEDVNPTASFDTLRRIIRPTDVILRPLSVERDVLSNGRQIYGLHLNYPFRATESTTVSPKFPALFDKMYDHFVSGIFGIVYDANNKILGFLDVYVRPVKIETKGDYMIRLRVTSDNEEVLDRLRNLVCQLDYSLSKYVYFDTYKTIGDIYTSKKATFGKIALNKGQRKPVFFAAPIDYSSYPKDAKPGDLLVGNLTFVNTQKVDGGQFKAVHVIPPEPVKPKQITPSDSDSKDEAAQEEELAQKLADAIRDARLAHLKKLPTGSPARAKLLAELNKLAPASVLPVLETQLEGLVGGADAFASLASDKAEGALSLADRILAIINLKELATFYGVKQIDGAAPASPSTSDASKSKKQLKKDSDKRKQLVVLAFWCKCLALWSLSRDQDFEDAYASLQQWLDNPPASGTDLRVLILYVNRERRAGRLGNAVKALNKYLGDAGISNDNTKDLKKVWALRLELVGELGWTTWVTYEERVAIIRAPPAGVAPF